MGMRRTTQVRRIATLNRMDLGALLVPLALFAVIGFMMLQQMSEVIKSTFERWQRRGEVTGKVADVKVERGDGARWAQIEYVAGGTAIQGRAFFMDPSMPFLQPGDAVRLRYDPSKPDNIAPYFQPERLSMGCVAVGLFYSCFPIFGVMFIANALKLPIALPAFAAYLIVFGLVLVFSIGPSLLQDWKDRDAWHSTQGEVVWINGSMPVVDFVTASGQAIRFQSRDSASGIGARTPELGSSVEVFYLPHRPYDARLAMNHVRRWIGLVFAMVLGLVLTSAGIWLLWRFIA
jgi:hypothetical protein